MYSKTLFSVSYERFSQNVQKNFKLAVAVILPLLLYRAFLLIYFKSSLTSHLTVGDYLLTFINGLRYDLVVAGYITAVPMIVALLCLFLDFDRVNSRLRAFLLYFYFITADILLLSHFLFYMEFNHNFDHLALGAIFDDRTAVLLTAWHQYPAGKAFFCITLTAVAFLWIAHPFIQKPFNRSDAPPKRSPAVNFIFGLLWLVLYIVMIRGSAGPRPVEPKDAAVTGDSHLNSHIVNPFLAAAYTIEDHFKMTRANGIDTFLGNGTINQAAARYFNRAPATNIDAMLLHHAKGSAAPPGHIFLIVMESMDAWDLLDQYRCFDLLPNLRALGRDGILLQKFISASNGTMTSLAAIITGLPDVHVVTNYQLSSQKPYPTSVAAIFKQLGYKTRFFYGGYLSWQRLQDFCQTQGFDEIYGGGSMGEWHTREWGIDDEGLFKFIEKQVDDATPTFNMIMSTSYHSPYNIDLDRWGFPYKTFPDTLKDQKANVSLNTFGHLWYTDKVLCDFIIKVQRQHPATLFAVTGDHRSHNYINPSLSNFYEQLAVPLLIYGMNLKLSAAACLKIAGSHMDIVPTLIELAAPKGFAYHSLGSDLLDPNRRQQGFGRDVMITSNEIVEMSGKITHLPSELSTNTAMTASLNAAAQNIRDYYALGWWRIMVGPELPH